MAPLRAALGGVVLLLALGGPAVLVAAPADAHPAVAQVRDRAQDKVGLPSDPLQSDLGAAAPASARSRQTSSADGASGTGGGRGSVLVILAGVVAAAVAMSARRVSLDRRRGS